MLLRKPVLWTLLIIVVGASTASHAQSAFENSSDDSSRNYEDLWVPSVSFALAVHNEKGDLTGTNDSSGLNFNLEQTKSTTFAGLRMGFELMSPTFRAMPFKPRFFAAAGMNFAAPSNGLTTLDHNARTRDDFRDVILQGKVDRQDDLEIANPGKQSIPVDDAVLFEGQGNRVNSEQLNQAWFLSIGAAFTYPQRGFTIRVKPSFEYLGESIKTTGEFILLTKEFHATIDDQENYTVHRANLRGRNTHHSVGPGLEVEFINHLDGNLSLSLFTQLRVTWILNNNKTVVTGFAANDEDSDPFSTVTPVFARYTFERDRLNFRGGFGLRLGWKKLAFGF